MKKLLYIIALISSFAWSQDPVVVGIKANGQYTQVLQGGIGQAVAIDLLNPIDSLVTAASDSLYLEYTHYQTGLNTGRRKNLRKNNGRIDYFPTSEAIPLNTVWRGRTGASNDTLAINPFNNYKLVFDGQTTGNAAYITGPYETMYIEKVATDTLLVAGANLVEYTYSSVNPWLIDGFSGSIGSEANTSYAVEAASGVYISLVGPLGVTESVASDSPTGEGVYAMELTSDPGGDGDGDRQRIFIEGLTIGEIYEYEVSYKMVTGAGGRFTIANGNGVSIEDTRFSGTTWVTATGEFTYTEGANNNIQCVFYAADAPSGLAGDVARFQFDIRLKND